MSVVRIQTISLQGMDVITVDVEVQISNGLPRFVIVGLPDTVVSESRVRVMSALNFCLPPKNIVVNLLPAHIRKEGSHYDLPIALCLLVALDIIPEATLHHYIAIGGLALDGSIVSVCGTLPAAIHANALGKGLICPKDCLDAAILSGIANKILAPTNLLELINYFKDTGSLLTNENYHLQNESIDNELHQQSQKQLSSQDNKISLIKHSTETKCANWTSIQGQESAKRAAIIALAGGHHLLLIGSPGSGKSMIAKSMCNLLPKLDIETALETTIIHNLRNNINKLLSIPPFREPHHGASMPALIGGGTRVLPGEISLANGGILFMDEFPEFNRQVLDSLREPMETGIVVISRANGTTKYPAKFQLVAAMNPCRCGTSDDKICAVGVRCRQMYMSRISGPLLDRFDLCARTKKLLPWELVNHKESCRTNEIYNLDQLNTQQAQKLVQLTREIQLERQNCLNINLDNQTVNNMLDEKDHEFLKGLCAKYDLSGRGYYRMLRVARTIEDVNIALSRLNQIEHRQTQNLSRESILEAVSYRIHGRE